MHLRLLLIIGCAIGVYANAIPGEFHFDDSHAIVDNPAIRTIRNVPRFFTDASTFTVLPENGNYRPLLLVTYAATAELFGVRAPAFIAVSLLVHIGCALLLYVVARRLLGLLRRARDEVHDERVALAAALLFAVHPLCSECVNYVHSRSESLCALLALASLAAYLRARATSSTRWLVTSALLLVAALCSKVVAGMLPFALLAIELAAAERQPWRRVAVRLGVMAAAVGAFAVAYNLQTTDLSVASRSSFGRVEYLRTELGAIFHYVQLFAWPVGQSADLDWPIEPRWLAPGVVLPAATLVLAIALAAWGLVRRRAVGGALSVAWFLLFLAPTSTVFPLAEIVNEHRPYLPAMALCVLAAEGFVTLWKRTSARRVVLAIGVAALATMATLTVLRNRIWSSDVTLWADVVSTSPLSARAHLNYGLALQQRRRVGEAERELREAVRLAPAYPYARLGLASLLLWRDDAAGAIAEADRALALAPRLYVAHRMRGLAGARAGEPAPAVAARFRAAVELSPTDADSWFHLSVQLDRAGDVAAAVEAARRAATLRAAYDDRLQLAYVLLRAGDASRALPLLYQLQRERPTDPKIMQNLEYARRLISTGR